MNASILGIPLLIKLLILLNLFNSNSFGGQKLIIFEEIQKFIRTNQNKDLDSLIFAARKDTHGN